MEKILRHAGFVRLNDNISLITAITWLAPEIVMFLGTIAVFLIIKRLTAAVDTDISTEDGENVNNETKKQKQSDFYINIGNLMRNNLKTYFIYFFLIGRYVCLISLCLASIMRPSVQGGVLFIFFLTIATWWSCSRSVRKRLAIVLRIIMVLVVANIFAIYSYQFQWTQEYFGDKTEYARCVTSKACLFEEGCPKNNAQFMRFVSALLLGN